jgi:hypothetical protein
MLIISVMDRCNDKPTVVVLHGMGQDERSNGKLRRALAAAGFPVWCTSYSTRDRGLAELAAEVGDRIEHDLGTMRPLCAVAHSMGAILVRHLASRFRWQRVVMLAPPNNGCRIAARLKALPPARWALGPAAIDLAESARWPDPPEPFAVIAGHRPLSLGNPTSWLAQALRIFGSGVPHDGTIAVDETLHPHMSDFALIDASHTGLLDHPFTARLAIEFLEQGHFASRLPGGLPAELAERPELSRIVARRRAA